MIQNDDNHFSLNYLSCSYSFFLTSLDVDLSEIYAVMESKSFDQDQTAQILNLKPSDVDET